MLEPFVPGTRLRLREPGDRSLQQMVQDNVQEGGVGLYLFALPFVARNGLRPLVLAEAYFSSDLRSGTWNQLDPMRRADWQDGRLVVLKTLSLADTFQIGGSSPGAVNAFWRLTYPMLEEVRRNNRSARADLKRTSTAYDRSLELANAQEADEAPIFKAWDELVEDAARETVNHAFNQPRVSGHNPRR